jgi:hypothetical protein
MVVNMYCDFYAIKLESLSEIYVKIYVIHLGCTI